MYRPIQALMAIAGLSLIPAISLAVSFDITTAAFEVTASSVNSQFESIGDIDGDTANDFFIATGGSLLAVSGADGSEIYRVSDGFLGATSNLTDDLNGDGVPEIFASANGYLALFSGNSGEELVRIATPDLFLYSRAIADVTGDGFGDLVLVEGLVSGSVPNSIVYVLDGTTLATLSTIRGILRNGFGEDVAAISDIDGDSVPDFAVAAGTALSNSVPEVFIYSGASQAFVASIAQQEENAIAHVRRIIPAGDFNGDGAQDIAVSGTLGDGTGSAVEIYSVSDGSLIRRYAFDGFRMTFGLATGSFDSDSIPDIAVGLATLNSVDVRVLSGANGNILRRYTKPIRDSILVSGIAASDYTGNGLTDLLVSRYEDHGTTGYLFTSESVADVAQESLLSGGWFDPAQEHTNEGVFFEFTEHPNSGNPAVTAIWYGYADDGNQKWYIGGPTELSEQGQARVEMFSASGAEFGENFDSNSVQRTAEGEAIIHIGSCNEIDFRMYFESGSTDELSLIPLLRTNLELDCVEIDGAVESANPTGIWWNASRSGEGFFIDTVESGMGAYTFSSWFAYHDGQPAWVVAGDFVDANDGNTPLPAFTSIKSPDGSLIPFGELLFDIPTCTTATATYEAVPESLVGTQAGSIDLTSDFSGDVFGGCLSE